MAKASPKKRPRGAQQPVIEISDAAFQEIASGLRRQGIDYLILRGSDAMFIDCDEFLLSSS